MNDYLLVVVYYQNESYDEFKFTLHKLKEARAYRDSWRNKESFTAHMYKVTHEITED